VFIVIMVYQVEELHETEISAALWAHKALEELYFTWLLNTNKSVMSDC